MTQTITNIRKELQQNSNAKVKQSTQRFFKETIQAYGIKSKTVGDIAKKHYKTIQNLTKEQIFEICEQLFSSSMIEETFIACNFAYAKRKDFTENDINTFQHWITQYVNNWATCDTLCNHTIGEYIQKYPNQIKKLKKWAQSKNQWLRRASAVTLIIPARKGLFLKESFEISDILLHDTEDLVQKGWGWLLKVQTQKNQQQVFDYIMKNKKTMPRTALRYAIEKMPKELKQKAMEK